MRIVIIGATSGIGRELALQYAADGHLVGITGRRSELLDEIKSFYPEQIFTACFDVTGTEMEKKLFELIHLLGGMDLFLYNAGIGEPSKALDVKTEIATTKVNVNGCVEMVGLAFNHFLQKGQGQIAITSSVAALRGNSWAPAYSASKAFVSNYAEGLNIKARRLQKDILVTDIRPGFVDTKLAKGNGRFWVANPQKAARQMRNGIAQKKRVVYITRRWWWVAQLMKWLPFWLYRRLG